MSMLDTTRLRALAGIVVAFALGGCAATNVGNTWQCPLVQGSVCARVAEADPAAPGRVSMDTPADVIAAPDPSAIRARRYRNATGARVPVTGSAARARESEPACGEVCHPGDRLGRNSRNSTQKSQSRRDSQAGTGSDGADPEPAGSWRDGARTPEVLGRIWIAPYVDGDGAYHEASWVRVVLEPARWRREP